jgi:hypothetical protein
MRIKILSIILLVTIAGLFNSCDKDPELLPGNKPPLVTDVSSILVRNYVNRIFIDLIGREPLDAEMDSNVAYLKQHELSEEARIELISRLQSDSTFIPGDSSYRDAYYHRFYQLTKVKMIEGTTDLEIFSKRGSFIRRIFIDSINGDSSNIAKNRVKLEKLEVILDIEEEYKYGVIGTGEIFIRLIDNWFYDQININTFNTVNSSFDHLFYRLPTSSEMDNAMTMIDDNISTVILGQQGQNKGDYLQIITNSREFFEGMITWAYLSLLYREPTTNEVEDIMQTFYVNNDFQQVQQYIMATDEYANFY